MSDVVLDFKNVSLSFGGLKAVNDFSFVVRENEILSLIGPNGSGKTTTFNLITGLYEPDSGDILLGGESIAGLRPDQIQGASFTITSLGGIGGTDFTPIVNAPEVAILGVSRAAMKPIWSGEDFAARLVLPISFSYDHRVIDGALGVRFTTYLCGLLSDLRRLLL